MRIVWTSILALLAVAVSLDHPWDDGTMQTRIAIAILTILAAWCVWYNRYSKGIVHSALARNPVTFPSVETPEPRPRAVCYRPATPLTFLRTDGGVALNLASLRTQVAGLYLCGLVLLIKL